MNDDVSLKYEEEKQCSTERWYLIIKIVGALVYVKKHEWDSPKEKHEWDCQQQKKTWIISELGNKKCIREIIKIISSM